MSDNAARGKPQPGAANGRQDATAPAVHVVRRILLRRGVDIGTEIALTVTQALQALYQAEPDDALRALFDADPPGRPAARNPRSRRGPATPGAASCDPLFTEKDARGA
jgi:hypothetical protein